MYLTEKEVTPHFKFIEFACKDGSPVPREFWYNMRMLAGNLEALRGALKAPIKINSAYRHAMYNQRVGGAKNSQHLTCNACDIVVRGYTPEFVFSTIIKLMSNGIMEKGAVILYDNFVHYDRRGTILKMDSRSKNV